MHTLFHVISANVLSRVVSTHPSWQLMDLTHMAIQARAAMSIHKSQIHGIIQLLEAVRLRPMLYIATAHHHHLYGFLSGLYEGCRLFSLEMDECALEHASSERGWGYTVAAGPYLDLVDKGLTEEECIHELLSIHILAWKRRMDQ
jgi:hypothetical protein